MNCKITGSANQGIYQASSFGYRVGALGFLASPELSRESPNHASGDYALQDQIAALRWVKANIGAFGGDPTRVAIFGQSAGAMSVSLLLASPLAKGLIGGAIGESGGVFEPLQLAPNWRLPNAEKERTPTRRRSAPTRSPSFANCRPSVSSAAPSPTRWWMDTSCRAHPTTFSPLVSRRTCRDGRARPRGASCSRRPNDEGRGSHSCRRR